MSADVIPFPSPARQSVDLYDWLNFASQREGLALAKPDLQAEILAALHRIEHRLAQITCN